MNANAIKYIREHTEDGQNIAVQTISRYYYINESDGDQWELLEDTDLLIIYKKDEKQYIDIENIIGIEI